MVQYLRVCDVLQMSEAEVGPDMLRDFGLLDSAVAQPQQTFDGVDLYVVGIALDVAEARASLPTVIDFVKTYTSALPLPEEPDRPI